MPKKNISIIGSSLELPGIRTLDDYWSIIANNKCSYSKHGFSADTVDAFGSVSDIAGFDYKFFNYSYQEACKMDPQQRLLLQHSFHALESSGYANNETRPITGIFASSSVSRYLLDNVAHLIDIEGEDEVVLGNTNDFLATRVAYKLGLTGPAMTIQTGCSSGLVSLHQARVALLTGQCDIAVVGAVSLSAPHDHGYEKSHEGIRSIDGTIRPFDDEASGTVFTNGIVVVVLKREQDAVRDRDNILATIKGSAVNNDGSQKASFTAPNSHAQKNAISKAIRVAGISAENITVHETHGTGTALGDPIEYDALRQIHEGVDSRHTCYVQSVKANVGHLDTASGLAGLMKATLCLVHKTLPPQHNFNKLNSAISFDNTRFAINKEQVSIKNTTHIGITALGIGGTNAHVIVSGAPEKSDQKSMDMPPVIIPISAHTQTSLSRSVESFINYLEQFPELSLNDLAGTAQFGRKHQNFRRAVVGDSASQLSEQLETNVSQEKNTISDFAFMFPGQGSQYVGMSKQLYESSSLYKELLDANLNALNLLMKQNPFEVLFSHEDALYKTDNTQPILLAVEVALARFMIHLGIQPTCVLGHSLGEFSAMVIAGALSFEDAAKIVCTRARLMGESPAGAMLTVLAQSDLIESILPDVLDIAAYNGYEMLTISGATKDIEAFEDECASKGIMTQRLSVQHPFHSRYLEPILPEFKRVLETVNFNESQIPVISNVTGKVVTHKEYGTANYWLRHLRQAVKFTQSIETVTGTFNVHLIEVGPGVTLKSLSQRICSSRQRLIMNTLPHPREPQNTLGIFYKAIASCWEQGVDIQWRSLRNNAERYNKQPIPLTVYEPRKCWIEPQRKKDSNKISGYKRYWRQQSFTGKYDPLQRNIILLVHSSQNGIIKQFHDNNDVTIYLEQEWSCIESLSNIVNSIERPVSFLNVASCAKLSSVEAHMFGSTHLLKLIHLIESQNKISLIKDLIFFSTNAIKLQGYVDPCKSMLQTSVKTTSQEYPQINTRLIDVDELSKESMNVGLRSSASVVALRNDELYVERFERITRENAENKFESSSPIVILGGTGHVGFQYARAIYHQCPNKIILVQRSDVARLQDPVTKRDKEKVALLKEFDQSRVSVLSADIGDEASLGSCLEHIIEKHGAIGMLIHTAGVDASMHYRLMKEVDDEFFESCLHAKQSGLMIMHALSEKLNIEKCHVISSISSVLSGLGMYVYSGIHAFIDNYISELDQSKWSQINWEAWEFGNAEEEPELFQQGAFGNHLDSLAMEPQVGQLYIRDNLFNLKGDVILSTTDLNERYLTWVDNVITDEKPGNVLKDERPQLQVDYIKPQQVTEVKIMKVWSDILGIETIGLDDNFFELGGHSLLALRMVSQLTDLLNQPYSIIDLFEYPTIRKLAQKHDGSKSQNIKEIAKERQNKRMESIRNRKRPAKRRV